MNPRVLIVGSIAWDDLKTPFGQVKGVLGGSAIYGSIAASCCAPVDVVGAAGEDYPVEFLDKLNTRGIDTRGVERIKGGKTFHWGGEYVGDMDEAITHFTHLNVFEHFRPTIPEVYRDDAIVFLANIDPELQLSVLDQMRSPELVLCDTMNLWINHKRDALLEVIKRVDVVLMNAGEARLLFDTTSLPRAGAEQLDLGLRYAIIKKGEHGVLMFSRDGFFSTPAMPLERVVDPTGAGDTFAGAFSGYLARCGAADEQTIRQAIVLGSAAASFVVEDFSIRRMESVTVDELEERCRRLTRAMSVEALRLEPR
jgi:sugar/nucleoside kinase (ribokinase family)